MSEIVASRFARRVRRTAAVVAAGAFAASAGFLTEPAAAAPDITPPQIKTNLNTGFVVGSVIEQGSPGWDYESVQEYIKWTATDNAGTICDFKVNSITYEFAERLIAEPVQRSTPTPYTDQINVWTSEYSGQEGSGGDSDAGWSLEARDCSNNATTRTIRSEPQILEENNFTEHEGGTDGNVTFAGTWGTVRCACASRGMTKQSTAKNASFTYTDYWNRDDHLGLVMAKGPTRGSAAVYVDGVKVATVNTNSPTVQNRVVVYDKWMAEGNHVVKVVNLATPGHARIDLDAVLNS